jgi:hypothetical protein
MLKAAGATLFAIKIDGNAIAAFRAYDGWVFEHLDTPIAREAIYPRVGKGWPGGSRSGVGFSAGSFIVGTTVFPGCDLDADTRAIVEAEYRRAQVFHGEPVTVEKKVVKFIDEVDESYNRPMTRYAAIFAAAHGGYSFVTTDGHRLHYTQWPVWSGECYTVPREILRLAKGGKIEVGHHNGSTVWGAACGSILVAGMSDPFPISPTALRDVIAPAAKGTRVELPARAVKAVCAQKWIAPGTPTAVFDRDVIRSLDGAIKIDADCPLAAPVGFNSNYLAAIGCFEGDVVARISGPLDAAQFDGVIGSQRGVAVIMPLRLE